MKIDKPGNAPPTIGLTSDSAARASAGTAPKPGPAPQDTGTSVSLGSTASQLSKMEASMNDTPVVDANKVAQIKQAISNGSFQVNSGVVANRLIQSVQDLLRNRA